MLLRFLDLLASTADSVSSIAIEFYDSFRLGTTASPRASDVGQLLITDADGITSISGGNLVVNGTTTGTGNGIIVGDGAGSAKLFTRADGLCLYTVQNVTSIIDIDGHVGWNTAVLTTQSVDYGILRSSTVTNYLIMDNTALILNTGSATAQLEIAVIMRSTGAYLIVKYSNETDYKLRWVYDASSANMYAKSLMADIGTYNLTYSQLKVAQLPAPFNNSNTDFRIFNVAGVLSAGNDQDTGTGDFIMRWTVDAIPSAGNFAQIRFRIQDTSNFWLSQINGSGGWVLIRVVAGTPEAAVMTIAGVVATDTLTIIADDDDITYVKKTAAGAYTSATYASASSYKTESATRTQVFGGGSQYSDWSCYPRIINGPALAVLQEVSKEP